MCERLEQLHQIKEICLNDLRQIQINCEQYSTKVMALTKAMDTQWKTSEGSLTEYDSFTNNMTDIMDAARKFNINMHLHSKKLSDIEHAVFLKRDKESKNGIKINGEFKTTMSNIFPAEECDLSSDAEEFVFPTLRLNEAYKKNDVICGTVTYIKNLKELSFYLIDNSSKYRQSLVELSKSLELKQYHSMISTNEVFGCVLDNHIFRAILCSKKFYDVETGEEIVSCYLLDTGEMLPLKSDNIIYKLRNDQKNIPAQAINCQLKTSKKNKNKQKLKEYEQFYFKIAAIENNTMYVEIVDNAGDGLLEHDDRISLNTNESKKVQFQLTEEELIMLYEEPLNTSNAMKAVMGYDPQDDKRICRFYNPSSGGCFKGANCKLEHTGRQPDGWTKDTLPSSSIMDGQHPITIFTPDSIINITPTYIGQLDRFYAQINDPSENSVPLVWNDEEVPLWKRLQKPPHNFELVLSRYVDGLWYRAKVMFHDDDYKVFKVFYVDYGNQQLVNLSNLASIDIAVAKLPFQAILCRLENIKEKPLPEKEKKNCIEMLCEMILNKSMDVKVISHYEDLFISFVDKKTFPLPDLVIDMGYLELNTKKNMEK